MEFSNDFHVMDVTTPVLESAIIFIQPSK